MRLLTAHKITIVTSILGCLAFVVWGFAEYRRTSAGTPLVLAVAGLAMAVGLTVYLRGFIRKHRRRPRSKS